MFNKAQTYVLFIAGVILLCAAMNAEAQIKKVPMTDVQHSEVLALTACVKIYEDLNYRHKSALLLNKIAIMTNKFSVSTEQRLIADKKYAMIMATAKSNFLGFLKMCDSWAKNSKA